MIEYLRINWLVTEFNMQEIIKSINEDENKAAEIKEQALQRDAAIAEAA